MRYLFINTAVCVATVALIEDLKIVSVCEETNAKDLSSKIFFMIDDVFQKSRCTPKDVNKIFIVNGPGSFTGIRIGLSIAKTMSWALGIDLIPVSSLELLATNSSLKELKVSLIDARRDSVYAGVYNSELEPIMKDQYIGLEDLLSKYSLSKADYISYDTFEKVKTIKPVVDILQIIKKHEYDEVLSCHKVNPAYLKLTEAEETREKDENRNS